MIIRFLKYGLLLSFAFIFSEAALAQLERPKNLRFFDKKKVHFGFTLGINTMGYNLNTDLTKNDSLVSVETNRQSGFNIGIVSSWHITRKFSLRFLPTLAFGQRNLDYLFQGESENSLETKQVESTYLQFPLDFKYRSERLNNFAAYVVGGANYSLDLASQFDTDNKVPVSEQVIRLERHNIMYEFGVGFDFFLEYFKFSPEIKVSQGINGVLIQDNTLWSDPIEKLTPRMVSISLHFEG